MKLLIVRHGEAGPAVSDAARTLTDAGRADVARVADALVARDVQVNQIRHSGRVRARETAEILAARLEPAAGVIETPGLHPEDPVDPMAMSLFGERESLMFVGHLPFVAHLVGRLTEGDARRTPVNFPTSTVACLEGEDDRWELAWIERPG
ncbi:MAG: phosphohistidine phosphatase SixA [Myxococcota bacterium]|jgi:phosphohistidine phosphatase|nr:phosphohistidine phosphatase SixA [Myxococcota bacterium]